MLITKTVTMTLKTMQFVNYYTKKGYNDLQIGSIVEVRVEDLPPNSGIRIKYTCEDCGKECETRYGRYNNAVNHICRSCNMGRTSRLGAHKRSGENHPRYNGGLSLKERAKSRNLREYRDWRSEVYMLSDYSCLNCNDNTGGNLEAHHIKSWDKNIDERYEIFNGVTLCNKCHKKFHDKYGYGNNNEEQLSEFMLNEYLLKKNLEDLTDVQRFFINL